MSPEIAVQLKLQEALQDRMDSNSHLGDRSRYIGASEIGNCLRRVTAAKLEPESFDAASMGRMLAGRALENEVVQLVRTALNGRLRNTGRNQLEAVDAVIPFKAHPDGRIMGDDDRGDGLLEVKTASTTAFKRYQKDGLPQQYLDQVQAQMGLTGLTWALVVLVSRENLAETCTFLTQFNREHYTELYNRALRWMEAMKSDLPLDFVKGEPDRGYCFNCPVAHRCPEHLAQKDAVAAGEIPAVVSLELEAELEELASVESALDPLQERSRELRDRIKEVMEGLGATKTSLPSGVINLVTTSRSNFDAKALQRELPEIHQRFLRTSASTHLRITFRGESA